MEESISLHEEVENLLTRAYDARVNDPALSVELAHQAVTLSQRVSPDLYAKSLSQLGLFCMIQGDFTKAMDFSKMALSYFEEVHNLKGIADAVGRHMA